MDKEFKQLQTKWDNSKIDLEHSPDSINTLYKKIKKKEKENFFFYYGTIMILTIISFWTKAGRTLTLLLKVRSIFFLSARDEKD